MGNVKYSIGNIVNNIVMTIYDVRQVLDLSDDHFLSYINRVVHFKLK